MAGGAEPAARSRELEKVLHIYVINAKTRHLVLFSLHDYPR